MEVVYDIGTSFFWEKYVIGDDNSTNSMIFRLISCETNDAVSEPAPALLYVYIFFFLIGFLDFVFCLNRAGIF